MCFRFSRALLPRYLHAYIHVCVYMHVCIHTRTDLASTLRRSCLTNMYMDCVYTYTHTRTYLALTLRRSCLSNMYMDCVYTYTHTPGLDPPTELPHRRILTHPERYVLFAPPWEDWRELLRHIWQPLHMFRLEGSVQCLL